jgi:hypothetical protein
VVLNVNEEAKNIKLALDEKSVDVQISAQAVQTIVVKP